MIFKRRGDVKPEELRVEKLNLSHESIIGSFKSYEKDLVEFLIEDSLAQQEQGISATYLWFKRSTNELVGYITLCPDSVKINNLRDDLSDKIRQKGIPYKSLPCLKIGRLCVEDSFLKQGIGRLMIHFVINKAILMNSEVGCRFVFLDAKRNADKNRDVIHFYLKLAFQIYKNKDNSKTTPLYLDILPILRQSTNQK
jgi:GNAT superfamily N-acetyltransferase